MIDYIQSCGDAADAIVETHAYAEAMYVTAKAYGTYAKWSGRPPLFSLSANDQACLRAYLRKIGMPDDGWFVCLHARSGGYSASDEFAHKYRSVDIESFSLAAAEIIRRGGWCIRVGDSTMRPYAPHERFIDYALSDDKSPQLDIALAAQARFFLGSSSGLFNVAAMFGCPCVVAHMAPLSAAYAMTSADISIPQSLVNSDGRELQLDEIMESKYANLRLHDEFAAHGLKNIPNTPEEILEIVLEMFDRLDGVAVYSEDDKRRQDKFRSYFKDGHYSYLSAANIGRDYLRRRMK